jgi:hypothetical protein
MGSIRTEAFEPNEQLSKELRESPKYVVDINGIIKPS